MTDDCLKTMVVPQCRFNMITTTYNKTGRLEEIVYSIKQNLENDLIEKCFILLEVELQDTSSFKTFINKNNYDNYINEINNNFLELLKNDKIEIFLIDSRPTYKDFFNFCNNYDNVIWILCNSDIHFPKWNRNKLRLLLDKNYNKETFVLTRYDIYNDLPNLYKKQKGVCINYNNIKYMTQTNDGGSVDSWIFKTPFNYDEINVDFELGVAGCDERMNYQLSKIKKVINPCLDIISIHKHTNWSKEPYKTRCYKNKKYSEEQHEKIMKSNGLNHFKHISFSKIDAQMPKIINTSYLHYAKQQQKQKHVISMLLM